MDSFLLCEFSNEANNKLFHVWLNKVQAVNVSMDNCFEFLIKYITYVELIIDMYCFNYLLSLLHIYCCCVRGVLLIDAGDELFMIFHLYIVNAVQVIAESFYQDSNSNRKDNSHLKNWVGCGFKGDESFEVVGQKLRLKLSRMADYVNYIIKLPQISSLIRVQNGK